MTVAVFAEHLRDNLLLLRRKLLTDSFTFTPLRPVAVPKKEPGKYRPILVPSVGDRVVQRAILNEIAPRVRHLIESPNSHAFRRGTRRGVPSAVHQLAGAIREGKSHVLLVDIKDFFPSVDMGALLADLLGQLPDRSLGPLLQQLGNWEISDLTAVPEEKRRCFPAPGSGLPQGSVLSPFLANFYLRDFDKEALDAGVCAIRYADDLAIPCGSADEARTLFAWLEERLARQGLSVHPLGSKKSQIVEARSGMLEYLGVHLKLTGRGVSLQPSAQSLQNAKQNVMDILDPRTGPPLVERYRKLSFFIAGWLGSYGAVCPIRKARAALMQTAQAGLDALLVDRGLIRRDRGLSKTQRRFLGVDSIFAEEHHGRAGTHQRPA